MDEQSQRIAVTVAAVALIRLCAPRIPALFRRLLGLIARHHSDDRGTPAA